MKTYTVTSTDDLEREPLDRCVIGSYTTRGMALDECVKYIMERLELRPDLAYSLAHDENHPEAAKFFSERRKDGAMVVRKGCVDKLRKFLRDELGGQDCYVAYDGTDSWHFDVDENDVEGELWHTVTWGDSDCEDLAFTTPKLEMFITEDTAILTFVNYVKGLMADHGMEIPDDLYAVVETQLHESGTCQVDLNDGCCVSCVLYHDDAENIKE